MLCYDTLSNMSANRINYLESLIRVRTVSIYTGSVIKTIYYWWSNPHVWWCSIHFACKWQV